MLCDRCGRFVDEDAGGVINQELGYANCSKCEAEYQESLRAEYPHGQCQECGAAYFLHTRPDGSQEYRAWHAEGGCSQWRDYADEDGAYYDWLDEQAAEQARLDAQDDPILQRRLDDEAARDLGLGLDADDAVNPDREASGRVDPDPVYEDAPSRIPGPKVDPAWVHQDGQGLVLDDDACPF